jgi:hypothetical protein
MGGGKHRKPGCGLTVAVLIVGAIMALAALASI